MACFEAVGNSHGNKDISINLDWKTGIAAKDWDSIARKEKIEVSSPFPDKILQFALKNIQHTYKSSLWNKVKSLYEALLCIKS